MKPYRAEKIAALIRNEISIIMQQKVYDPRLNFVDISYVRISTDLRMAKVYISVIGDDEAKKQAIEALQKAKGFIKRELAKRMIMRFMPDLEFVIKEEGKDLES